MAVVRQTSYRPRSPKTAPRSTRAVLRLPNVSNSGSRQPSARLRLRVQPFSGPISASVLPDRLDLVLPIPPSINHQYATVNGRRVLSARGRNYKTHVAHQTFIALARAPERQQLLTMLRSEFLGLSVQFHFPTPLRRDVDGGLKITQDALCEALGINDNRILHIHLFKALDVTHPRIEVSLFRSTPDASNTSRLGCSSKS